MAASKLSSPSTRTLKILFARSGNRCAFPGCQSLLIDKEDFIFGRVCHIEAASKGGPRYSATQKDEERHHVENLIVFCPHHHIVIDTKPQDYTVTWLKTVKATHEASQMAAGFKINTETLDSVRDVIREEFRKRDGEGKAVNSVSIGFEESIETIQMNVDKPPEPKTAESYFQLGLSQQLKGNVDDALESYKIAISIDENHWEAKINLGNVFMLKGEYEQANYNYQQVLDLDERNYAALVNSGFISARQGHLYHAIDYFLKASRSDPERFEAWFNLGNTYLDVSDVSNAIMSYRQCLSINPEAVLALIGLADAFARNGDYDNSIEEYLRAMKIEGPNSATLMSLGAVYAKRHGVSASIPYFLTATQLSPDDFLCWYNLGNKYRSIRDFRNAIACYEKAKRLPSIINYKNYRYDLFNNLGVVYLESGNEMAAIDCYKIATEISPESFDAWLNLCLAYSNSGNIHEAKKTYEMILGINPSFRFLSEFLGRIGSSAA